MLTGAIITQAGLSFLGLDVQFPTATWGNMMNSAQSLYVLQFQPWLWLPSGIAIGMTVLAVNFTRRRMIMSYLRQLSRLVSFLALPVLIMGLAACDSGRSLRSS